MFTIVLLHRLFRATAMSIFDLFGALGVIFGAITGIALGGRYGIVGAFIGGALGVPVGIASGIGVGLIAIVVAHVGCRLAGETPPLSGTPKAASESTDES